MNCCRNKQPVDQRPKSSNSKASEVPHHKRQTLEPLPVPKVETVCMLFSVQDNPENIRFILNSRKHKDHHTAHRFL